MTKLIYSAAAVLGLTTLVHLFAGTGEIMTPILQAETLHPVVRNIALVVWHMVTLILLLSTFAIAFLARQKNRALAVFILALNGGFALIFIVLNIASFNALFVMPQWIAFALVTGLLVPATLKAH